MNYLSDPEDSISELGQMISVREIPAWVISLGVHVLILFVLFSIQLSTQTHRSALIASAMEELDPESYKFDPTVMDQITSDGKLNFVRPSQSASTEVAKDRPEKIQEKLDEEFLTVNVPITGALVPRP